MQNVVKSGVAAAALVIGLGACASTPEEPAPAPVVEEVAEAPPAPAPRVEEAPTGPVGPAAGSIEDFRVNVGERVYFDLDQWRLDDTDRAVLQRQAAWLQSYPNVRILVAGNCDERGTREYNLALGERRASIVRDYLVGLGVDGARIETVSYGKERPIDGGSNESSWALNRNGFTQIVSGARTS
ncbi:MAG: peptidoglycan-associated lipoprotein Pal [Pseudomonadota bacterium]